MKRLFSLGLCLAALALALTTGAFAWDLTNPPVPETAENWYETSYDWEIRYQDNWFTNDHRETEYVLDSQGRIEQRIVTESYGTESVTSTDLYTYDDQGRVAKTVQEDGNHETVYTYRADGSYLETYTWTDSEGETWTNRYTYDPEKKWFWHGDWSYEFDEDGHRLRRYSDTREFTYEYETDGEGRILTVTETCTQDHTQYIETYTYAEDGGYTIRGATRTGYEDYVYNAAGQLTAYIWGYEDEAPTFLYTYDEAGNCILIDGGGSRWRYEFTELAPKPELTEVPAVEATCEEAGNIQYWTDGEKYYADAEGETEISLDDTVIPATGHDWGEWVIVKEPTVTEEGLRQRICRNDASHVETETIPKLEKENPFTDVPESVYYTEPVLWAVQNGITNGTSAATFSPDNTCTRGQIVTFLWRAKGSPEPKSTENPFDDVDESMYYYKAVLWAVENGITNGISSTQFGPDNGCTRAQVVTFLWRAEGKPAPENGENPFVDVPDGMYYTDAVLWAVEKGITNGVDKTHFGPDNTCTRGQIVTFLYRDLA